ncbi:MAG TPA: hypothetical protein VGE15_07840 [Sphingobacteriaceae bacterium]
MAGIGLFCSAGVKAQDARMNFQSAYEAYEAGDFSGSLAKISKIEQGLGKTNPRIQSFKAVVYNEMGDVKRALYETEVYFRTSPDKNSSEYDSMVSLYQELKDESKARFDAAGKELERQKQREIQEAEKAITAEKDQFYYKVARQAGTIEAYELFLQKNSTPELKVIVEELLAAEKKKRNYDSLITEGLVLMADRSPLSALEKFQAAAKLQASDWLSKQISEARDYAADLAWGQGNQDLSAGRWTSAVDNFKRVLSFRNSSEAKSKLQQAEDEAAYAAAVRSADAQRFKSYLQAYPNGLWKKQAEKFLLIHYKEAADRSLTAHQSAEVKAALQEMKALQASEYWQHFKTDYYRIMLDEAVYLTSRSRKERMQNIGPAIAYYEELNEGSGTSYGGRLKALKWKNKEWNRPGMGYIAYHSDASFDEIGLVFGMDKNRGVGVSVSLRAGLGAFAADEFKYTGKDHVKGMLTLNFTKKIIYPLWIYAGGGYTNFQSVVRLGSDQSKAVLGDEVIETFNLETGVSLHLKPVYLSVGSSFPYLNAEQNAQLGFAKSPSYMNVSIGFGW